MTLSDSFSQELFIDHVCVSEKANKVYISERREQIVLSRNIIIKYFKLAIMWKSLRNKLKLICSWKQNAERYFLKWKLNF